MKGYASGLQAFTAPDATDWGKRYSFELVDSPDQLDQMMAQSREKGTRARLVAYSVEVDH